MKNENESDHREQRNWPEPVSVSRADISTALDQIKAAETALDGALLALKTSEAEWRKRAPGALSSDADTLTFAIEDAIRTLGKANERVEQARRSRKR